MPGPFPNQHTTQQSHYGSPTDPEADGGLGTGQYFFVVLRHNMYFSIWTSLISNIYFMIFGGGDVIIIIF